MLLMSIIVMLQVKSIVCDADELSHWLTSYRDQLKTSSVSLSALPDIMQRQLAQFMVVSFPLINVAD